MRMILLASVLAATAFVTPPAAEAGEQVGSYHENKRWGFKVRAPKKWKRRAIRLDEKWIAEKFFPPYELAARNEQKEVVRHKPDMWVIGFPHERGKERVQKKKLGENSWLITIKNPYKDYKDFVKRESWASTGGGGWFYSRDEIIEHNDYQVEVYEIKVEKLVRAPLRVITWVYRCADCDFAIQIRILEEQYAANKGTIHSCLKSFRITERTEPFPKEDEPRIDTTPPSERKERTLEEINAERTERVERRIAREIKNLPKGWKAKSGKHFVALTQVDNRLTGYVLNYARSIRSYLDKHFSHIGPAKVPRGVIRIFSSSEEERAYQQGTRGWWTDEVGEITMTFGRGAGILSEFSWLADRLTDQYFHIKNENLKWGMPSWLRSGIWGHIRWARPSKRKKMVLAPMPQDIIAIRKMLAAGEELGLRELMTKSNETSTSSGIQINFGQSAQANSVVYWLLNAGNRGKVKGGIARYLQALESIIKEEDEKFEKAEEKRRAEEAARRAKDTEADEKKSQEELEREEEERFRGRREKRSAWSENMKAKYEAIRIRAVEAAFGDLTQKDWDRLDARWKKFASK